VIETATEHPEHAAGIEEVPLPMLEFEEFVSVSVSAPLAHPEVMPPTVTAVMLPEPFTVRVKVKPPLWQEVTELPPAASVRDVAVSFAAAAIPVTRAAITEAIKSDRVSLTGQPFFFPSEPVGRAAAHTTRPPRSRIRSLR
jgi:hypothetical protein